MSTRRRFVPASVTAANRRLDGRLRGTWMRSVQRWKTAKAIIVSVAILAVVAFAIENGAPAREALTIGIVAVLLVAGVEGAEIAAVLPWGDAPPPRSDGDDSSDD
jgi:peptidoglycan/LPS O-acetylase OafA/YrhL